jgi:hypothetical protein
MKRILFVLVPALLSLGAGAALAAPMASANRETQALNLLEAQGYGSFTNFHQAGGDYTATVTRAGHAVTVRIDPQSGQVATIG